MTDNGNKTPKVRDYSVTPLSRDHEIFKAGFVVGGFHSINSSKTSAKKTSTNDKQKPKI
jgi:hypothetical protein